MVNTFKWKSCFAILWFFTSLTVPAYGAKFLVYVELDEQTLGDPWAQPTVHLLPSKSPLAERVRRQGGWAFTVKVGDKLITPLLIDFEGKIPQGFSFKALRMELSFSGRHSTFIIRLAPVKTAGDAIEARKLYSTELTDVSEDQLPVIYHRARAASEAHRRRLAERWHKLHDYDVQVVFKYLEIVREINERTYILPPDDIDSAKNWLQRAITNKSRRVEKAVGVKNARQLIRQTEENEARRFTKLWTFIENVDDCRLRNSFLQSYHKMILEVPTRERRGRIKDVTGVYTATVLSSIAQCLSINIRCYPGHVGDPAGSLAEALIQLRDEKTGTFGEGLKKTLDSDIENLSRLKSDIKAGRPLLCRERVPRDATELSLGG